MNMAAEKLTKTISFLVMCLFMTGCGLFYPPKALAEPARLSAWLVYWDEEPGEKDLSQIKGRLQKLSFFSAHFDEKDKVFIPKKFADNKKRLDKAKGDYQTFLTFVNDKKVDADKMSLKDTELLKRLFASDESMKKHIDEIIKITKKNGYDGIEIDYERLWVEPEVGAKFSVFINRLAYQAVKNGLKLRVILEPGIPFDETDFAKGPEYVVMLYNLYGTHSGPGPKADKSFIERTIKKMETLPTTKAVAFSTGGCIWGTDGSKKFITEQEAVELQAKHKAETEIDTSSHARHFQFMENGYLYTVWYADSQTLNYWISTAKSMGIKDVSLWRLGGNEQLNKLN